MRLPDRILHTACLLAFKREVPHYAGSGFVVAVSGAHGNSHLYLVTAKHLAERMQRRPMLMGFSQKDGRKAILEADNVHWYFHPTEADAVDAAVTPFAPAQWDLLDIEPVPERLFSSVETVREASIAVGDEITAVSVFTRFSWEQDRHLPIVRTGNLAMLPTLRIPVEDFEPMEAYVAEIDGLSGSPIWVRPPAFSAAQEDGRGKKPSAPGRGDADMVFLGLLHGRWEIPEHAMEGQTEHYTEMMVSGMSIIVPAHKILEIIHQPELAAMRKKLDEKIAEASTPAGR